MHRRRRESSPPRCRATGDHVLALGVDQVLAVELVLAGRGIAGEGDAGGRILAHVAEHHAWVVGISAVIGSLVPLAPFPFLPVITSMWVSVLITAAVLFAIGAYKARVTIGHPMRSGLQMTIIGTLSALAGFAVGALLKVPAVP